MAHLFCRALHLQAVRLLGRHFFLWRGGPQANDARTPRRSMKSKASKKHPKEYKKARERYPSPEY